MSLNYCVIDIETEGKEIRSRFCDPLEKSHKVVMCQTKIGDTVDIVYNNGNDIRNDIIFTGLSKVLVGQNIKFDLLYLWKNEYLQDRLKKGLQIWDTRTVDYLINSCRTDIRYSLDAIADRYGLGQKYDKIKKLYHGYEIEVPVAPGLNTKVKKVKIPGKTTMEIIEQEGLEEFTTYAKQDVILTEQIYLKQLKIVKELGMEELVSSYMNYYLTIIETEFNGLYVDLDKAEAQLVGINHDIERLMQSILWDLAEYYDWPIQLPFNINSGRHLSALLFGGVVKYKSKEPKRDQEGNKIVFKSGKNKGEVYYRTIEVESHIKGCRYSKEFTKKLDTNGAYYETDSSMIARINKAHPSVFLDNITEVKKLIKLRTDIKKKIISNVNPSTRCLHSEFNTTSTVTGRLSSSNPNSQNLHPRTLDLFTSRYHCGLGTIVEFDWSQVEVAMAAYVFNDKVLKYEILNGVDMHLENAALLYCKPKSDITKAERKTAKFMTFGILYGQSAYGLAKSHNIDIDTAEIFINAFFLKYKGIKAAHNKLDNLIKSNASNGSCVMKSPTNKQYYFTMYERKNGHEFNSSQYKNYILQGTAGDLHAYCVGSLFEFLLLNRDRCVIINNVHDSIIFDCSNDFVEDLIDFVKGKMNRMAELYTDTKLFTVDVKVGRSWGGCKV